jgi:GGDEF domain-containing protein
MTDWIIFASLTGLASIAALVRLRKKKDAMLALMTTVATAIPSQHSSFGQLVRELERARRYRRPLTLIVLDLQRIERQPDPSAANGNQASPRKLEQNPLITSAIVGRLVRDALRQGDLLAYNAAHNRYIVALPETDRSHALLLAARLYVLVWERAQVRLAMAVTEFPSDGFTADELLGKAQAVQAPITLHTEQNDAGERPLASSEAA